jgi:hypothetical protein
MIERLRGVDRHDYAAGEERREVSDDPVDAVVRNQRHAIACAKSGISDRAGDVQGAFEQSRGRRRRPLSIDAFDDGLGAWLRERSSN